MKQQSFASDDFERYRKPTRREQFLAEMDKVVPWQALCQLIEPYYPKAGNGRPPIGLERMLRIYFLQHWFNLSDPGAEEALYESRSMCRFVGIDLGREPVPDESTILGFRHLLERNQRCFRRLANTSRNEVCVSPAVLLSTPPSSTRRVRRRTKIRRAIPICIRRRRETSGTSA